MKKTMLSDAIAKLQEIYDFYGDMPLQAAGEYGEPVPAALVEVTNADEETVAVMIIDAEQEFNNVYRDDEEESA
jgi:hypothetical protein